MYSSQLLDHFQNPRNPGEVEGANALARIENPACGDMLSLSAKIDGGRIQEIRFKAKGCVAAMACASAVTELVKGKSVTEAAALRREDIAAAVGGLPEGSMHATHLAIEALFAVLSNNRSGARFDDGASR
jgi:SUF system NifU family Fe-S assembly protein